MLAADGVANIQVARLRRVGRAGALAAVGTRGVSRNPIGRRAAWGALLDSTARLPSVHELVAQLGSLERSAKTALDDVVQTHDELSELARRELTPAVLPENLRDQLAVFASPSADSERFARTLLGLNLPTSPFEMAHALAWMTALRMQALNAWMLSEIAAAAPSSTATSAAGLAALTTEAERQADALVTLSRTRPEN